MVLVVLGSVLGLSRGYADAPCYKGFHGTTPEELAQMTETLEAARAAVPAPPPGWVNSLNDDSVSPPNNVCLDFYPWTYSYSRHYTRVEGAEERERVVAAAGADFKAAAAARQPRLDAYMAEMTELSTRYAEAVTSGDGASAQAATLEMEQFKAEFERFMSEDDSAKAFEAATASQYVDLGMVVRVTVNPGQESHNDGAQPFDVPGAASAYQWTSGDDGQQGNALVLFGEWQPSPSGFGLESAIPAGAAPEQPHTISIRIHAYKDRLPSMIEATDFDAMAALLAR
jgi:hypothetical protein